MFQGTNACKLSCKLHTAHPQMLGFTSSSFSLLVSISVLGKWNETRTSNSSPKASTPLFSHLWNISYFKYMCWPYHFSAVTLLKIFQLCSICRDIPGCYPPGNSEEGLKIVTCSVSGWRFDSGTENSDSLQHGRRAAGAPVSPCQMGLISTWH